MGKKLTVVIAANDANAPQTIKAGLQVHKGWTLHTALNEDELLELALNKEVDAIVLESLFPGRALRVLSKLQSNPATAHIPVLAVSGNIGPRDKELLDYGASKCVKQALGVRELTTVLREMVAQAKPASHAPKRVIQDSDRMSALEQTGMLDYTPSKEFAEITRLAAKILGVPIALVSLVDKDRQYFLCQHGLVEPWASQRETPLSQSFCQWVVASNKQLVVDDAREHKLLAGNKAVNDLGVIAYAGQPIKTSDDQLIGSFCAIDSHPRSWTFEELTTLNDLTRLAETYIIFEKELANSGQADGDDSSLSEAQKSSVIQAAAGGIKAISRLLAQIGVPLDPAERKVLVGIIQTLSEKQLQLASA